MLKVNPSQNTDTKQFYREYIKNFRFMKQGEVDLKANLVFCKILIIGLYISICGISSNYIFSVFFLNESASFPDYFISFIKGIGFWVWIIGLGFLTTSIRILLKKLYNYAYFSPIRSKIRCEKLLHTVKHFPELKLLVSQRINERGFISEMDYNTLCIEKIYREIIC